MRLELECKTCGKTFNHDWYRGQKPGYCSEECRRVGFCRASRRNQLLKAGKDPKWVAEHLKTYFPKRVRYTRSKKEEERAVLLSLERRCQFQSEGASWEASVSCVTLLSSYNPGPFCYVHAALVRERKLSNLRMSLDTTRGTSRAYELESEMYTTLMEAV